LLIVIGGLIGGHIEKLEHFFYICTNDTLSYIAAITQEPTKMHRKLPALTADNRAFWQGGEQGRLFMHWCEDCTSYFHPPGPVCPKCASLSVRPKEVSGKATVVSFTINYQPWTPNLAAPFAIAIVELPEQPGLRFLSNVEEPVEQIYIGMPLRVVFEQQEDVWIPLFIKD
tara:strand:- start:29281 stop:29793 length:513 start_codon:yes stop_codon:yes gene_type:complete